MKQNNAMIFLSGRLVALVVLLIFQVSLVRLLAPADYGHYALVLAWATLMQTVISFGVPRLIPKYVSQAGWTLSRRTVARLIRAIIVFRVVASAALLATGYVTARALGWASGESPALLVSGGIYILASIVQVDSDAMAQALSLQGASRLYMVGEAVTRLVLMLAAAALGGVGGAATILAISAATATAASLLLLRTVFVALAAPDPSDAPLEPLNRREFRALALSGYASAMAWFATSPSVIRLLASRVLAIAAFAGFAFAQTLILSFQRYTPGMMLFPFVEPMVMKHHARTGDTEQLAAALSLVTKIDMILIGAAVVGTTVAGRAVVELMTGGRYGALAWALPWLLVYILASSAYRAFEIVAVALGAAAALMRTLALSLFWLLAALLLSSRYGLIILLVCPVGDSLSRLALMWTALRRHGVRRVIDEPVLLAITLLASLCAGLGVGAVQYGAFTGAAQIGIGTAAAIAYLVSVAALRPLRRREIALADRAEKSPVLSRLHVYARG